MNDAVQQPNAPSPAGASARPALPEDDAQRYRRLFENSPIGIYTTTPDGRILMANQAVLTMLRFDTFEELQELNLQRGGFHPDTPRENFLRKIERDGHVAGLESMWLRRDGSVVNVRESARAVRDASGKTIYYEGTVEDITKEKAAEASLEGKLRLEKMLTTIASQFASIAPEDLDDGILESLKALGGFTGADRVHVLQFSESGRKLKTSHEWKSSSLEPGFHAMAEVDTASFRWLTSKLQNDEFVAVQDTNALPAAAAAERAETKAEDIQSLLVMPLTASGTVLGGIAFEWVWKAAKISDDTVAIMSLAVEAIAGAIERRRVEDELRYRLEFEELIISISSRFVNLLPDSVDAMINSALRDLGEFAGVDSSFVFQLPQYSTVIRRTHFWKAGDAAHGAQNIPVQLDSERIVWAMKRIRRREPVCIASQGELPREAVYERKMMREMGIASVICIPFSLGVEDVGFLGFAMETEERVWKDDMVSILKIVGEIFAGSLDRKRTSTDLTQERRQVDALMDNTPDMIYFKDRASRFTRINRCMAIRFKLKQAEDATGKTDRDFFAPEHADAAYYDEQRIIETGESILGKEEREVWSDGSETWASTTKLPLYDNQGKIVGTFGISRDITQNKLAEQERRKIEQKMQQAQKLESMGLLSSGIAHDFNKLLMGILGNCDMALHEIERESPVWNYLKHIETISFRAAELTNQMLVYAGKSKQERKKMNLTGLVREMATLLGVSISANVRLVYGFMEDLPVMEADPAQIRQVVMNLITNASDAIGTNIGTITVNTGVVDCDSAYLSECYLSENMKAGSYVYLEVADTGKGMDAATQAKIFDPFFTTKATGHGLGLAALLGIVRSHGGAIRVYSELGKGTTFKIMFPACGKAAEAQPADDSSLASWRGWGTVLVVDDDDVVRAVSDHILSKFGFKVLLAGDSTTAFRELSLHGAEIEVVLLDLSMPDVPGAKILEEIRKIRNDVPVILMSGYSEQVADTQICTKTYAAFLQKPFNTNMLVGKVRAVMEKLRPVRRPVIQKGGAPGS